VLGIVLSTLGMRALKEIDRREGLAVVEILNALQKKARVTLRVTAKAS